METPTQPARPIEMRKSARCGHRVPVSLRGCLFAVALVLLWSTAHAVGTPNTPVRPLLAAVADDEAAISERADRLTLLQEAPAPIEDEVDEGEFPNLTDPPMPTNTAAPPEPTPTPTTSVEPTPTLTTTVAPNTNNVISNNASNLRGTTANSVSPTLLVGFAVLCSAFLALWVRRRRDSGGADGRADGGEGGDSSMSDMATTSSTEKREDGGGKKKTQYSRLDNRAEEEELLDDEFGGRSGSWDDWENNQIHQRIDIRPEEEEEESRTGLTKGLGSSSIVTPQSPPPKSTGSVRTSTAGVKLTSPPSSSSGRGGGGAHLQDVVVSAPPPRPTSVASDSSSNESFEVVVSPPAAPLDLLSGGSLPSLPITEDATPPASTASSTTAATTRAEDDLFSQFGLVPTFKKGVQQTPVAVATPVARSTYTAPSAAFLNPFAASPPPSSTSLFAADMDDMDLDGDAAAGANEWGDEEDDWVQGL